jgi:3-methylfumaryl-CoA hydratase
MSETLSPELQSWVGRRRVTEEDVGLGATRRIASMLDLDPGHFRMGDPLPGHWFSMYCAETGRQSDLGPDGHPNPGVFLPPIGLPRRMGAGRRVTIHAPLRIGDMVEKTVEVAAILPKQARTGFITVLTMRHTIESRGQVIAVEEFDAMYRDATPPGQKTTATPPVPAPEGAAWADKVLLSSPLVFRYSSVTWNAHCIHYDADYARDGEGYDAAVQNGGLTMQLILDGALKRAKGRLVGFTARLARPLWVGDTVTLCGAAQADGKRECWATDKDGYLCAKLEAEFA